MMKSFVIIIKLLVSVFAENPSFFRRSLRDLSNFDNRFQSEFDTWRNIWASRQNLITRTFPRYEEIETYVKKLANTRKELVSYFSIGKSTEGRDIWCVKLSTGQSSTSGKKPGILIDGGIHAREWIAVTTALYAIEQLVDNPNNKNMLETVDFYIIPVLNPDGYEYSHQDYSTRLWRKTRSLNNTTCKGADLNRNFDVHWMATGGSLNSCDITFAGKGPMSEPESQALARLFQLNRGTFKVYVSLHSAGNYIFHPWGFSGEPAPHDYELKCTAAKAAKALSTVPGRVPYSVKEIGKSSYPASGMSMDYALAKGGVDLSYTIELLDWRWGFTPPESEIEPVGKDFFNALKVFVSYVKGEICNNQNYYG